MMFGTGELFKYAECQSCCSLALTEVPQDLAAYYPASYYSLQPLVESSFGKNLLKKIRYDIFRVSGKDKIKPVYGDWFSRIRPPKSAKIADIGCGNGQLLYELYAAGFSYLRGFDPFMEKEQHFGKKLVLSKKDVFEIQEKFDLIMMHHALEHMESPKKILEQCSKLLNPKGWLLIRLPVADAKVWTDEGVNWVQLDPPRHLHIPSTKGLKQLGTDSGLACKEVVFDSSTFQFWGTELVKNKKPLHGVIPEEAFSRQDLAMWRKKALLYNKKSVGDQACFYFYKA